MNIYNKDYSGFVYRWINIRNNKKYIGSHYGSTDDGYTGSGIHFKRAYKIEPENFQRLILEYVLGEYSQLQAAEQRWIDSIDINEQYYNIATTVGGGPNHGHLTDTARQEIYRKWRKGADKYFAEITDEERRDLAKRKRTTWQARDDYKDYCKKKREDRLAEEIRLTDEEKEARSLRTKNVIANIKKNDPDKWNEWQLKRATSISKKRSAQNLKYINRNGLRKMVPAKELKQWLADGWIKGMG